MSEASNRGSRPWLEDADLTIYHGDVLDVLYDMSDESVDCVVTSPPYWGHRDYGAIGQIGIEATPEQYIKRLVGVFSEVRRILKADGTLWLNLGDRHHNKQVLGAPWRVAFGMQADGWLFRSDIIWHKPSVMPESVTDRPTKAHEYLFLFTKTFDYFWDQEAVREPTKSLDPSESSYRPNSVAIASQGRKEFSNKHEMSARAYNEAGRNIRTVWTIAPQPYHDAHYAVMPSVLVGRCITAGCRPGGTVLDPFGGSGTTALSARKNGRKSVLIELNEDYCELAARRLAQQSLFAEPAA